MMIKNFVCLMTFLVPSILCSAGIGPAEHGNAPQLIVQKTAADSVAQLASRLYNDGYFKQTLELTDTSAVPSAQLAYYQGMSAAALYDYPRALECFQNAVRGDTANVNYRYQYGRFLMQAGFTDDAVRQLETCIAIDSLYLPASFQLGLLFNAQKTEFARQVEIFSYLVRRNPNDFLSLYYKGDALCRQLYQDSGMVFIQQSADLNPRYFPSIIAVAHDKNAKKDTAGALAWYLRAEAIRPRDKDLLYYIGECYRKLRSLDTAVSYFKRSIAIDPANALVHAQLGYAYYSKGRIDSSIASYNNAIALDEENMQYYLNLAMVYDRVDSSQKVIETYQRLIDALHPENMATAWQYLASYYSKLRRPREAAVAYQHVFEFNPENKMALMLSGDNYESVGDYKTALTAFERIYQSIGDSPTKIWEQKLIRSRIAALKKKMQ